MAASTRAKARQTRLTFQSTRSSSPPAEHHTEQGARDSQDGVLLSQGSPDEGKVRDEASQARTRNNRTQTRLRFENLNVKLVDKHPSLPTPVATSQPSERLDDSEPSNLSPGYHGSLRMAKRKAETKPRHNATAMFKSQITPTKTLTSPLASSQQSTKKAARNPLFAPSKLDTATSRLSVKAANQSLRATPQVDSDSDVRVVSSRRLQSPESGSGPDEDVKKNELSSDQDDLPPTRRSHQTAQTGVRQSKKRPRRLLSRTEFESPHQTLTVESSGDGSDVISPAPRKRLRRRSEMQLASDERNRTTAEAASQGEILAPFGKGQLQDDEVLEDAEDLKGTELRESRTRGHTKRHEKRNARAKQLQIIRARRQGKDIAPDLSDSSSSSQAEEEDLPEGVFTQQRISRPDVADEDVESFVVEDEDGGEDASWRNEMPLELSSHSHMDIKEYFKQGVEWMVHRKLNPAFNREDPLYVMAFRKIDDEAKGYAGSKFTSSSWKPEFKRALEARPDFTDVEDTSPVLARGCEACGRTTHPAKWRVTFSGGAYDPKTLESLKEEDSDDSENETQSHDADGHTLARQDYEFQVGRHCKSNAFIAHSLLHWRWHLNQWVLQWLEAQGYTTPERLVEREGWSTKRRGHFANKTIDEMVENKEIKSLWRDFKRRLEEARSSKVAAFGRGYEVRR